MEDHAWEDGSGTDTDGGMEHATGGAIHPHPGGLVHGASNSSEAYPVTMQPSYASDYTDASAAGDLSRQPSAAYTVHAHQHRETSPRHAQANPPGAPSGPHTSDPSDSDLAVGRTSIQANKLLVEMFETFSSGFHKSHPFTTAHIFLRSLLLTFNSLAFLLLLAAMWVSYGVLQRTHILVECCILTVNWLLNAALETYLQYLTHTEMLRLLRARMELVLDLPPLAETRTTEMPPSSTFVRTLRDGLWRPLPMNLLVSGDVIELDPDDRAPCPVKRVFLNVAAGGPSGVSTAPPVTPAFSLPQTNWSSQTQLLQQSSYSNLRAPSYPPSLSAQSSLNYAQTRDHDTPHANRFREQSHLSSIRSDSAAEAAEDEVAQVPRSLHASAEQQGVEMASRMTTGEKKNIAVDVFNTNASVASSYSATPSPLSSQPTMSPPLSILPTIPAALEPPPPPPSPPAVPAPHHAEEPSMSASGGMVVSDMSSSGHTPSESRSPGPAPAQAVHIHIDPSPVTPHATGLHIVMPTRNVSDQHVHTPHSHLDVPHLAHGHHHNHSGEIMSPVSSISSVVSMDPETKERFRQTDVTFLPATVLQPLQQQQLLAAELAGSVPIKSYSTESATSTASTVVEDDAYRGGGSFAPSASHSSSIGPPPNVIPGLFSNLADEGPRHYIVEESPLKGQLEFILRPRAHKTDTERLKGFVPPTNTFLARFNYVLGKQKFLVLGAMALYWLFVFLRLGLRSGEGFMSDRDPAGNHTYEYIWWVLYCSALLAMPILNISNTFWLFILDTVGNSLLIVTQEEMQNVYDDEMNADATPVPKKTTASLFSSASRKRAMKKRMIEAAKAKARAAQRKPRKGAANPETIPTAKGLDSPDDDESSVSSVSSVSSSSSEDTASSISTRDSDEDELDEDAHTYSIVDGLALPFTAIMRHSWDILTGNEFYITRTVNPLQVLGGITVFCSLDNEGILSENEPSADHICFLNQPQPAPGAPQATRSNASSTRQHHHHHRHTPQPKVIVLDLMNDPDSANGIVIEGDEWHDQHLNSLKPLGLNAILNNACNLPQHMLSQYEFSSTEPTTVTTTSSTGGGSSASPGGTTTTTTNSQDSSGSSSSDADTNSGLGCLCTLGKEIGFDVNFIKQQYYIGKVIYTVAVQNTTTKIRPRRKHRLLATGKTPSKASSAGPTPSTSSVAPGLSPDLQILSKIHTMTSMSVQDRFQPSSLHLMTNGDPFLVLFHSTHFWNGRSIQPLSEHIRTQILGIYQQWNHQDLKCLAYSYSPIFPPSIYNYVAMFNPQEKVEYVIENLNEEYEARRRHKATAGPTLSSSSSASSISTMSDTGADHPTTVATDAHNALPMPQRRRYATEHSTIVEQDEDDQGTQGGGGSHAHHGQDMQRLHDQLDQQHDHEYDHEHDAHEHAHDVDDHFIEHSQQEDVPHHDGLDDPMLADVLDQDAHQHQLQHRHASDADLETEHEHVGAEYSRSYSTGQSQSYAPMGTAAHAQGAARLTSPNSSHQPHSPHAHAHKTNRNNGAYAAGASPRNNMPPPPPSPPLVPAPNAANLDSQLDITPSLHDESISIPPADAVSVPPTPAHDSSILTSVDTPSQYILEAYTPKPRKSHGGSGSMTKSQSFPSGFQPHLSLGSILTESSILQSNLQPPVILPSIQRHQAMAESERLSTQTNTGESQTDAPLDIRLNSGPLPADAGAEAQPMPTERDLLKTLQSSQIFLGMIAMRDQPKIEVRALVEDMKNAGIRFVFFSPDNERKTQAFGAKIGLNTDFNFYVSLRDPEAGEESAPKRSQGKSQLPCGVSAIRNHLQTVDNVPLLVSLFTDCDPTSCCDMIRIYQENGESVMCMGSSLKVDNVKAFMQADISASLDPMPSKACPYKTYNKPISKRGDPIHPSGAPSTYQQILQQYHNANNKGDAELSNNFTYSEAREFAASSAITSMPCALLLSATTDLHHFMGLIASGRRLLHCMVQSLSFSLAAYLMLFFVLLVNFVVDAPPILNGYQILWLIWIIIPLLSISLLGTPRELDLMRNLPQKNSVKEEGLLTIGGVGMLEEGGGLGAQTPIHNNQLGADEAEDEIEYDDDGMEKPRRPNKLQPRLPRRNPNPPGILTDTPRYFGYFLVRFCPSALIYLVFYLWFLHESFDNTSTREINRNFYWSEHSTHSLFNNSEWQSLVLTTQNYSLVVFVFILVVHSMGFVYRYDSVRYTNPASNRVWIVAALGVLALQVLFCLVSVYSVSVPTVNLTDFRWYVFLPWPVVILALDELCKAHDRSHRDFNHKKARQHFDTVLGMHSPK